jgi:hypothetical protein
MCAICSEGGRYTLCGACRERAGVGPFPFRRDAYTLGALFEYAWKAYKIHWQTLVGAVMFLFVSLLILGGIGMLFEFLFEGHPLPLGIAQALLLVPQLVVQGTFVLGILHLAIKIARGEPTEVADVADVWRHLIPWLVQSLILFALFIPAFAIMFGLAFLVPALGGSGASSTLVVVLASLLVVPLSIYVVMGFAFANMEIVAQPNVGPIAGLRNSWLLTRGKRLELLLFGLVFFALYIGGVLMCLVGALFTLTYFALLFACYYLALRNGAADLRT